MARRPSARSESTLRTALLAERRASAGFWDCDANRRELASFEDGEAIPASGAGLWLALTHAGLDDEARRFQHDRHSYLVHEDGRLENVQG